MAKISQLSLINANVLHSSKIQNVSLIPSYFMISKKLENIGDNIFHLTKYMQKNKPKFENRQEIIDFLRKELTRSIEHLTSKQKKFKKMKQEQAKIISKKISRMTDGSVFNYLKDTLRYVIDIEDEILNISFYNSLIEKDML